MKKIIKDDLYRYIGHQSNSWANQLRYILFTPGFTYIYFFRRVQLATNVFSKIIFNVLLRITMYITHIQIPPGTKIGRGFRIVHFGHIVINPQAIIGENFNISQGVLIGNSEGRNKGTPIIGNSVQIGANAVIVGNCKIGDNVLIAPLAFVNFDVPSNSVVVGNPGKIIPKDNPTQKYIVYSIE